MWKKTDLVSERSISGSGHGGRISAGGEGGFDPRWHHLKQTASCDGIKFYAGVQDRADAAAKALAEGNLAYDPDARCDHHDHDHGDFTTIAPSQ